METINVSKEDFISNREFILSKDSTITIDGTNISQLNLKPKYYYQNELKRNITFMTFGNEQYRRPLYRIICESLKIPIFKRIIGYDETALKNSAEFWSKNGEFILNNPRGYGFWIWKSYLILKTLEQMDDNDILIYADSGCCIYETGLQRLNEYITRADNHPSGMLTFQTGNPWNLESYYTKMDVIKELNAEQLLNTYQIIAGIQIIRKNAVSIRHIQRWYDLCCNHHLISDKDSIIPNTSNFKEHRHDQSIFSILCKLNRIGTIPDETETGNPSIPIHAARKRDN